MTIEMLARRFLVRPLDIDIAAEGRHTREFSTYEEAFIYAISFHRGAMVFETVAQVRRTCPPDLIKHLEAS